jgi:hypothetical protein
MKVLVGVPVFRVPDLVRRCLGSLVDTPADILVIDNAADADVKSVVQRFGNKVTTIANASNGYCNGGWNQTMEYGLNHRYDLIGLGSSDVSLHPGWYEVLVKRAETSCNEVWIPTLSTEQTEDVYLPNVGWYFSFLPRKAVEIVYPIPCTLRHWFGDTYMRDKLISNGWKHVLAKDIRSNHEQSAVTCRVPEAYAVIEQDKEAWSKKESTK